MRQYVMPGVAVILMVMILTSGCRGAPVQASAHNLQASSSWDGSRITGTVQNNGPSRVACVLVEYALVNQQGSRLKTVSARKQDGLGPRDSWDFSIPGANAVGARRTDLSKLQPC